MLPLRDERIFFHFNGSAAPTLAAMVALPQ